MPGAVCEFNALGCFTQPVQRDFNIPPCQRRAQSALPLPVCVVQTGQFPFGTSIYEMGTVATTNQSSYKVTGATHL